MNKLGNRLRELRKQKGYSQQQLADHLHLSRSSIEMYESGERDPSTETKEAIADFFNVNMDYLFGRQESNEITKAMELYARYKKLTPEKQADFLNYLGYLQSRPELPYLH